MFPQILYTGTPHFTLRKIHNRVKYYLSEHKVNKYLFSKNASNFYVITLKHKYYELMYKTTF